MGLDISFNKIQRKRLKDFRKVNFLVGFFEKQGMRREHGCWYPSIEEIQELLDACNQVLKDHSKAKDLLPTTSGFLFGNYEYNDIYFNSVEQVKEFCEETLIPKLKALDDDEYIEFAISY